MKYLHVVNYSRRVHVKYDITFPAYLNNTTYPSTTKKIVKTKPYSITLYEVLLPELYPARSKYTVYIHAERNGSVRICIHVLYDLCLLDVYLCVIPLES